MKQEEVLIVEHREIVELYKHWSTNIVYCFISYIILNGVLVSFLGMLLSAEQLTFVLQMLVWVASSVGIIGGIIFVFYIKRLFHVVFFLADRGIEIEDALRKKMLTLNTFKTCVAYALRPTVRKAIFIIAFLLIFLWIAFIIVIFSGYHLH